ncbi:MAG TPA: 3D domain-containing protein [Pyrinomonadaceae bacterium]|nr:3D domain-containing protein [Pyrinomonadaceae bacterium]
MKFLYGGSAALAATLFACSFFYAIPLAAEPSYQQNPVKQSLQETETAEVRAAALPEAAGPVPETALEAPAETPAVIKGTRHGDPSIEMEPAPNRPTTFLTAPQSYMATAYCFTGRTASGRLVARGLIAADPRVLPLGSRVRIEAGQYSGEYMVADTGGAVRGRRIDVWVPNGREATRFGRRQVKLTVISYGGRRR